MPFDFVVFLFFFWEKWLMWGVWVCVRAYMFQYTQSQNVCKKEIDAKTKQLLFTRQ